jgi:hypothetical protein
MSNSKQPTDTLIDKKRTKFLMVTSAAYMGIVALAASFLPEELLQLTGTQPGALSVMLMKIISGLYLGFALLNWMARSNLIGAIYSRPVAVGNFGQFLFLAIILLKQSLHSHSVLFATLGIINFLFASAFGYILFSGGRSCG